MAWLRRILANKLTDATRHFARRKRDAALEQTYQETIDDSARRLERVVPADQTSPSQIVLRSERARRLADALSELPEDQRVAVELHHLSGFKLAEVAAYMERTHASVRPAAPRPEGPQGAPRGSGVGGWARTRPTPGTNGNWMRSWPPTLRPVRGMAPGPGRSGSPGIRSSLTIYRIFSRPRTWRAGRRGPPGGCPASLPSSALAPSATMNCSRRSVAEGWESSTAPGKRASTGLSLSRPLSRPSWRPTNRSAVFAPRPCQRRA